MPALPLTRARLVAQALIGTKHACPVDAVRAFGAMQGQELPGVLASAALRSTGAVADAIADLDGARLVRGYPMRGTVFLMAAADVTWITELCAAAALRAAAARRHKLGLDEAQIERALEVARGALADGPRPRAHLLEHWQSEGLAPKDGRGYHLLFTLVARNEIVYGPWNGSEQDVALVAQWLPGNATLDDRFGGDRTPAVAELLLRYLTSHGPATLRDFAWWTKLGLGEIRAALPLIAAQLESDGADEASYWRPGLLDEVVALGRATAQPLLLPGFDEYILGYRDRLFAMPSAHHERLVPGNNGVFKKSVVLGGRVCGTWSAGPTRKRALEIAPFEPIAPGTVARLEAKFRSYPFIG